MKMNEITAKVPTYRSDISIFEDIVEEVGRIDGYEKVPSVPPKIEMKPVKKSEKLKLTDEIRLKMVGYGFSEAINYAFAPQWVKENLVKVDNPLSKDFEKLKNSLIFNLIENVSYNISRQEKSISLFEIGNVYYNDLTESTNIAGIMTAERDINWKKRDRRDFFDLKEVVENLLEGFDAEFIPSTIKYLHPYQTAEISIYGNKVGYIGKIEPKFAREHRIDDLYIFEINIDKLLKSDRKKKFFKEFSQYPKVRKDLSVEISENIKIIDIIKELKKELSNLENIGVFDVYRDKTGKISVAIYMEFRKINGTLEDEEINRLFEKAIETVQKFDGVKIRGLE
jgi:phenylalanyl-tRNA synthetase beta chain